MTTMFRYLLPTAVLLLAPIAASSASAQSRNWIAEGLRGEITARDCAECGDDIGITIACQGEGQPALISVPFAASNEQPADGSRITFRLDSDEFGYDAAINEQGAIGFVPQFGVRPNDPLIAALQSAGEARVSFEGRETRIGLRGSRSALEIFKAHCGWNGIPFDPSPLVADGGGEIPADGPVWFATEYVGEAGAPGVSLVYGVPETDDILVATTCAAGTGTRSVSFNLSLDTGAALPGSAVQAAIGVGGNTYTYPGKVYEQSTESAGLSFEVGSRAPLWDAMRAGGAMTFGIVGGASVGGSASSAQPAVDAFTSACFSGAVAETAEPLVKLDLGTAATDGAAVPAAQPLVKLDLSGSLAAPQPKPLVDLGATASPEGSAPLIKLDLGTLPQPVLAATAPAGSGTRYVCDDGSSLSVDIADTGTSKVATVAMADGQTLTLPATDSSFAERYAAGEDTLRISSGILLIARGSDKQFCELQ